MATSVMAWPTVALGEVLGIVSRPVAVQANQMYALLGMHWYAEGLYIKDRKLGSQIQASTLYQVRTGDFVYNRLFGWKGSFGIADESVDGCYVSNEFPCFQIDETRLHPAFLRWYFAQERVWEHVQAQSSGSTPTSRLRLKEGQFLALDVPLPPLDEQRRIVARIEALAARIAEARGLRQAALAEAEALMQRAVSESFDNPALWRRGTKPLGDISDVRAGVTLGRVLTGNTIRVPYLRVANVQDGYLDLATIKEVEILPDELEKWRLQPGDILLTEGGDWDKLGRGTVWMGEVPICIHQNHIFRVRVDPANFVPQFVAQFIGSRHGKEYFQAAAKQTTNLATINQRQLKSFEVICPPISEQQAVLARIGEIRAKLAGAASLQGGVASELNALLPALLDKAFRGEL